MKIIITESKLNQLVIDYLNKTYNTNNIYWEYGEDDWGNEVGYAMKFYQGDYDEDDTLFRWYGEDYWDSEDTESYSNERRQEMKDKSPILSFEDTNILNTLTGYFGNNWKQPFIEWFWHKFQIPVKSIE
jgi:hypothetical protein